MRGELDSHAFRIELRIAVHDNPDDLPDQFDAIADVCTALRKVVRVNDVAARNIRARRLQGCVAGEYD